MASNHKDTLAAGAASTPTDVPVIYDRSGDWSGMYVDQRGGYYQVRTYGTEAIRSARLKDLSQLGRWLSYNNYTCPAL